MKTIRIIPQLSLIFGAMIIRPYAVVVVLLGLGFSLKAQPLPFWKQTELSMKKVSGKLYACETEVSNGQYLHFLNWLQQYDTVSYRQCLPDSGQWFMVNASPLINTYHRLPGYAAYPAVNISKQGAIAYCAWLTQQYMQAEGRTYKKVIFRLPKDDEEWAKAALGTEAPGTRYPWGNDYAPLVNGQYRCNFNRLTQKPADSVLSRVNNGTYQVVTSIRAGAFVLCPVKSFAPNSIGLYNLSGNVAEMLAMPVRTKGGSWNSEWKFMKISALDEYEGVQNPSPYIGFRVFMEVVE